MLNSVKDSDAAGERMTQMIPRSVCGQGTWSQGVVHGLLSRSRSSPPNRSGDGDYPLKAVNARCSRSSPTSHFLQRNRIRRLRKKGDRVQVHHLGTVTCGWPWPLAYTGFSDERG